MDVFSAFPNAVVSGIWQLGKLERSTETGISFSSLGTKDVIIDEISQGSTDNSPRAASLDSELLIYAKPSQMPTANTSAFITDYLWYDSANDQYYAIVEAAVGKNQEVGQIEHFEFRVRQTEVANG